MPPRTSLKEFQQALAQRMQGAAHSEPAVWLGVEAGSRCYLLRLEHAQEVLPLPEITVVPLTRPWFLGLANVRGQLVCVTDLAALAGDAPAPRSPQSRLVLFAERLGGHGGVAVSRTLGLKTARSLEQRAAQPARPWISAAYVERDELQKEWLELDLRAGGGDEEFRRGGL
jgi:twitching motility protein PilI